MKSKKKIIPILIVVIAAIFIFSSQKNSKEVKTPSTPSSNSPKPPEKIRACPDAWYKSMIPIIVDDPSDAKTAGQYFIVDGQRRELAEYDVEWIIENCEVNNPSPLY